MDAHTMEGFRSWRAAACDRCHGANQEGLVGPSLIEALKVLTPEQFKQAVTDGRLEKGMPSFKTSPTVMEHLDDLYTYLKGRSDGAITPGQGRADAMSRRRLRRPPLMDVGRGGRCRRSEFRAIETRADCPLLSRCTLRIM